MLGIGFPERHALPRITPTKCTDRELRSPPARAGSFLGATAPSSLSQCEVRSPPNRSFASAGRNAGPFPKLAIARGQPRCG